MVIGVGWQQYHYKHQTVMILRLQMSGLDWESDLNNFALDQNSVPRQINTLLYCLGEDAKDVLTSTEILNEGRKKYAKFWPSLIASSNHVRTSYLKRARFNRHQ